MVKSYKSSDCDFTDEQILRVIQRSLGRKRKTFGHGFPAGYQTVSLRGRTYARRIRSSDDGDHIRAGVVGR